jgi:hypothetical protein
MNFTKLDKLKAKLDNYRPLKSEIVQNLREDLILRWTYNSNAEGNTLTLNETKVVLEGITVGGTQLNNQEMRNALYVGKVTKLLNRLAKSEYFLLATDKAVPSKRMKDKYIILRFLGFFLWRTKQLGNIEYKSDIDEFLAPVMRYINNHFTDELLEIG